MRPLAAVFPYLGHDACSTTFHGPRQASPKNSRRLKERGRPAHRSCFDVGGTPTLLEFSSRFRFFSPARAAALALALLAAPFAASGQTWDGSDSNLWSTAGNWVGGVAPASANTTNIIIAGTANVATMYTGNVTWTIKSLTFDASNDGDTRFSMTNGGNPGSAARNLTFSSNSGIATLTVAEGSTGNKVIDRTSGGSGTEASIILTSSLDVIHNGSGTLTLGNGASGNGTSRVSGAGSINKSGTGTLILAGGNNSYTGATNINAGAVTIQRSAGLGGTGNGTSVTATGASLQLDGTTVGALTVAGEALSLNGTGISGNGSLRNLGGANSWSGAVTLANAATIQSDAGSLTLTGGVGTAGYTLTVQGAANTTFSTTAISGTGGLTKSGTGNLTLSASNTYNGTTTINEGTLQLGGGGTTGSLSTSSAISIGTGAVFSINRTNTVTQGTDFSGSAITGTGGFLQNGSGTTVLNATNTYNGTTTLNAGTLQIDGNIANSGLVLNSGGIISPGTSAAADSFGTSSITINGGGYNWTINTASGSAGSGWDQITSTGALTSSGLMTIYAYGTPGDWNGASSYDWDIFSANSVSGFSAGNFTMDFSNFGIAAGNRTGTWSFSNPSGGIIRLSYAASGDPAWVGGSGNWDTGFTPGVTDGANIAFTGAGGTATNNISTGNLTTVGDIEFRIGTGAYTLAADAGAAGASGGTALTVNGSIINSSTATQTINTDLDFAATRTIAANTGNITIGGAISGAGGLTKNGSNKLTLTAANTYTGDTTINTGTLEIGSGSTTGSLSSSSAITNNASLVFNRSNDLTVSNTISGTGNLTKSGAGTLTLSGANTYNGTTTVNAGTLAIGNTMTIGAITGSGNLSLGNGFTLTTNSTSDSTFSGVISGSGALTKAGSSTLTLSGNNTYTGTTTVSAGTLKFQANTFNATSRNYTITSGAVLNLDGANRFATGNSTISGSGKLLITGGQFQGQATASPAVVGNISLGSGGTIEIASGATLYNGGWSSVFWTSNLADIIVDGTLNVADGRTVIVDALTGSGTIDKGFAGTVTLLVGVDNGTGTFSGIIKNTTGSIALTKNGTGTQTLTGNNTYSGATTISAGTIEIGAAGRLGGGNYSQNIANNGVLIYSGTNNQTLGGVISGTGALTQNAASTLTLSGNSNFNGATTINAGTLVIGHANAAGSGTITQANSSSLLKFDTTGTITNAMSVYNVLASQSATLSGAITVNNAVFDVATGETLTISNTINGTGGVTKNGTGTLVLSGSNSYSAPTVINAGTLNATTANALGSNNTVQINGGTLLVTADDAINGKNITMSTNTIGLQFSGTYSGAIGNLTLSANSIIDLGAGSVQIRFQDLTNSSNHTLSFYNWSGTVGGNGTADTDKVYFGPDLSDAALAKIYFYSGPGDSFLGSGFELGLKATGFDAPWNQGYQIIPGSTVPVVPEPETYATGLLLLLGGAVWMWKRKPKAV